MIPLDDDLDKSPSNPFEKWYNELMGLDEKVLMISGGVFLAFITITTLVCCRVKAIKRKKQKQFELLYQDEMSNNLNEPIVEF